MSSSRPGQVSAADRDVQAREYLRLSLLLRERENADNAAGALLYEAAKQCINAVANLRTANPGPTGAKIRFLTVLAEEESAMPDLLRNWQHAADLHINADRLTLNELDFETAWSGALKFIDQMLQIYAGGE